jgi:hypothetical protein
MKVCYLYASLCSFVCLYLLSLFVFILLSIEVAHERQFKDYLEYWKEEIEKRHPETCAQGNVESDFVFDPKKEVLYVKVSFIWP